MPYRSLLARIAGVIELLVGIGAVAGGAALIAAPSGALLGMPVAMLRGTPFRIYLVPGAVLLLVVGGANLAAGLLALRGRRSAPAASVLAGVALLGWMGVQVALIGYRDPLQLVYLAVGVAILSSGVILTIPARV